jgi:CspA family cold shock protein
MSQGTIKFFNAAKGFGFVTPDGGGADIFLPAAAVTAAGVPAIKPGQRIAYEQAPDTKGPKIVSLTLVGEAPARPQAPAAPRVTIYGDAGADATADAAEAVRALGFTLALQDIATTPPSADQLKRLSQMLNGQSLVRRYDPLFFALQLDDRFITDQDFWTAIVEHPTLLNGPVVVASGQARICKSEDEVRAFLRNDQAAAAPKPKTLSPRIAAMLSGKPLPEAEPVAAAEAPAPRPAPEKTARVAAKPDAKAKPAVKAKPAAKPVKAVAAPKKPAAGKPAKAAPKSNPLKKARKRARA